MKILLVCDKKGTAIDILAGFIQRENKQHQIDIVAFHPKRPDTNTVEWLKEKYNEYDLIHWCYWRSWEKAKELIPDIVQKKSIVTMYNPYDLDKYDWKQYHSATIVVTKDGLDRLPYAVPIRLAVDEELYQWQPQIQTGVVGMCANRIEGKKGVLEVAEKAKELGYQFRVIGRISDGDYWLKVTQQGDVIPLLDLPFEQLPTEYGKMRVFVCNSVDNFETGPMPVIEAMLTGVPVCSRRVGTIGEVFEHEKHLLFHDTPEELKANIKRLMEDNAMAESLRQNAWKEAKNLNSKVFAWKHNALYHKVVYPDEPLVSVIMPYTQERVTTYFETSGSINNQTYKNTEMIMGVDNEDGYNLAKLRNRMLVEAHGEYVLFMDDRWKLHNPDAIAQFVAQHKGREKVFLHGQKLPHGKSGNNFVENFSFTKRQDLINAGMFNERIDIYGGMSQEIRTRLNRQGWKFEYCENAKAEQKMSSHNRDKKQDVMKAKIKLFKLGM